MSKSKSKVTRRDLLKVLGGLPATFPLAQVLSLAYTGFLEKAYAQVSGAKGKRYIYFIQEGAPARWTFDLFLTPYQTTYTSNPHIGTMGVESGGRYVGVKYQTIARKGIQVPPIWGIRVPDGGSGTRPLDVLLDNMLVIRGAYVESNQHPAAQNFNFRPPGAQYNLLGMNSDAGDGFPIKGLDAGSLGFSFVSARNFSPVRFARFQADKLGSLLLDPFNSQASSSFRNVKGQLGNEMRSVASALDSLAFSQHPGAGLVKNVQSDASEVMGQAVTNMAARWNTIYAKYDKITKRALSAETVLVGVTDKPVGAATRPSDMKPYALLGTAVNTPLDMREMFTTNSYLQGTREAFALVELAITENLCNSISAPLSQIFNMTANGKSARFAADEHDTGSLVSLLGNTKLNMGIGACLVELVNVLKSQGLFDETVIHLGGEFNRNPRPDQSGSDHGNWGQSATLISGMVSGPLVIGNIRKDGPENGYPGTWGYAAPSINNRNLDLGDINNAVATMLGLPQVVRKGATEQIVEMNSSGKVVSKIGTAKQV